MKRHETIEAFIKKVAVRLLCFAVAMFWLGYFFGDKV
jgi:hypothetical protein